MATSADIAVTASNYQGNAALGAPTGLPIQIDTRPIQQLAAYTLMYNRSQYDQRQKDADEKIKKLGALAPYDLVNGIEKDATELKDAQAKLTEYMADYAAKGTPKTPAEKIQNDLDFQKKIADQIKLINAANDRRIKLDLYKGATQKDPKLSAAEKELRIKQAEKIFNDTDIYTLPEIPEVGLTVPKNGAPIIESVSVLKTDKEGNAVIDESIKQFSIGSNWKASYLDGNNLNIPMLPPNATDQQKAEYEQNKLSFGKSDLGVMQTATDFYNQALADPNYKKTITTTDINVTGAPASTGLTAEVDVEKIKASNPIVGGIIGLAERYNAYAEKRLADIKQGYYIDNVTGEKVLLTGGDKAEDVIFIDVTKPLTPQHLSFLDRFSKAAPDQIEKKYIANDNALQRENQRLDFKVQWKNAETARINALKPDGSGSSAKDNGSQQTALIFGKHINTLKEKFANSKPNESIVISFKGTDPITAKALGLTEGQFVMYKPDGTAIVGTDEKGNGGVPMTIEQLKFNFLTTVKGGSKEEAQLDAKFVEDQESGMKEIFNTTNGQAIWDSPSWNKATTTTIPTTTDDDSKLTDAEYYMKYKKSKTTIIEKNKSHIPRWFYC